MYNALRTRVGDLGRTYAENVSRFQRKHLVWIITVDFLQLFFIPGSCDTPKLNKGEQMLSPRIFRKITPEEKRKACIVVALTCIYTIVN